MDIQTKFAFEKFQICVDFTDVLGDLETIKAASSNVYAYSYDGTDVTSSVISNENYDASGAGKDVSFYVGNGYRWERYLIKVQIVTENVTPASQQFEKQITVMGWALTTLDEVKSYISPAPSSSDYVALLNLIGEATDFIERRCNYPPEWHILETKHDDELYDGGGTKIFLRQYPVLYLEKVEDNDLTEVREMKWRDGTYTSTTVTVAAASSLPDGFAFTAQDATHERGIEARSGTSGKEHEMTTANISSRTATVATLDSNGWSNGTPGTGEKWRFTDGLYLYPDRGIVEYPCGFTPGNKNLRVTYRAGYRNIPGDLNLICKKLVANVWMNRDKEGLISEKIGNYSYSRGALSAEFSEYINSTDEKKLFRYRLMDVL